MSVHQCPVCRHLNAAVALRCAACSADLSGAGPPPRPPRLPSAGAIWLDDLAPAPPGAPAPPAPPAAADADGGGLTITLRDVASGSRSPPRPSAAAAPFLPFGGDAELVASDPARPLTHAENHEARRAADKSAHRAAVRLERLRAPGTQPAQAAAVSDVLVVDADPGAREVLTALLRGFGFTVHPHAEPGAAAAWAHRRTQVTAAFFDLPPDPARAEATLALCKSIRGRDRPGEGLLPAVLVLVAAQLRPADRVRAELAGCDATITKPVTRGSVAGVLDARGVTLPADARRR